SHSESCRIGTRRFGEVSSRSPLHWLLLVPVRLTPTVLADNVINRNTANRPETAHRVADRQKGIRVHVGRQAESGLDLLLETQIERRKGRTETERTGRQ